MSKDEKACSAIESVRGSVVTKNQTTASATISVNKDTLIGYEIYLKALAKVNEVEYKKELPNKDAPVAIVDDFKLMLNIKIDKKLELARLQKEISRLNSEIDRASSKLDNKNFVNKAPKEVIKKEKERLLEFTKLNDKMEAQLKKIKN